MIEEIFWVIGNHEKVQASEHSRQRISRTEALSPGRLWNVWEAERQLVWLRLSQWRKWRSGRVGDPHLEPHHWMEQFSLGVCPGILCFFPLHLPWSFKWNHRNIWSPLLRPSWTKENPGVRGASLLHLPRNQWSYFSSPIRPSSLRNIHARSKQHFLLLFISMVKFRDTSQFLPRIFLTNFFQEFNPQPQQQH